MLVVCICPNILLSEPAVLIFFLSSTEDVFDPRPAQSSSVYHSLTDLLCHISPAFKQTFVLKNR